MASGGEWSCPICCNALGDAALSMPCRHQFCPGCILRWLRGNRACPLCRTCISTVSFSEQQQQQQQDCPQRIPCRSAGTPAAGSAPSSRDGSAPVPAPPSLGSLSPPGPQAVGGILPELWAELFRRRWSLLDPVRSWLRRGLRAIYGHEWWQAKVAESSVLLALCIFGPDRDALVQRLQLRLREHTAPLVQGVLSIIATQCTTEVRRLRRSHRPGEHGVSPGEDRQSPGEDRRSPQEDRQSPGEDRRSPREDRQSPREDRRSPGEDRQSPREDRRSPGEDRRSPREDRRSPGEDRRSLENDRQSPREDRRSLEKDRRSPREDRQSLEKDRRSPRGSAVPAASRSIPRPAASRSIPCPPEDALRGSPRCRTPAECQQP